MQTHHELVAWQRARAVSMGIFHDAARYWRPQHAAIWEQVRRSSLSVHLNIAEGYAIGRSRRCKDHIRIAYGSAVETTELLDMLIELAPTDSVILKELLAISRETQALTLRLWLRTRT